MRPRYHDEENNGGNRGMMHVGLGRGQGSPAPAAGGGKLRTPKRDGLGALPLRTPPGDPVAAVPALCRRGTYCAAAPCAVYRARREVCGRAPLLTQLCSRGRRPPGLEKKLKIKVVSRLAFGRRPSTSRKRVVLSRSTHDDYQALERQEQMLHFALAKCPDSAPKLLVRR